MMIERMVKLSFLTILGMALFASHASAELDYETAYMVRNNNSHVLSLDPDNKYSYFFGETPWVYIKFKLADLALNSPLHMLWVWSSLDDPNNTQSQFQSININALGTDKELWTAPPEPWWTNSGGPGEWHVDINWFNVNGTNGISAADFISCPEPGILGRQGPCGPVLVPEPLSATLFLLGGAPILAALRKRQKLV